MCSCSDYVCLSPLWVPCIHQYECWAYTYQFILVTVVLVTAEIFLWSPNNTCLKRTVRLGRRCGCSPPRLNWLDYSSDIVDKHSDWLSTLKPENTWSMQMIHFRKFYARSLKFIANLSGDFKLTVKTRTSTNTETLAVRQCVLDAIPAPSTLGHQFPHYLNSSTRLFFLRCICRSSCLFSWVYHHAQVYFLYLFYPLPKRTWWNGI